jgi:hypothetical protein
MHGTGTRKFANGDVYVGRYYKGQRVGQGKLFFANGDLYSGSWENDLFHGFGRYYYSNSIALQGSYENGMKQGKFKLQHPNGNLDIVRHEQDVLVGSGVRWSADRSKTWLLSPPQKKKTLLGNKNHKRRISIAEAVSIGYDCEAGERGDVPNGIESRIV